VAGGEVTCGGEMVGGESSWWRDDRKPLSPAPIMFELRQVTTCNQKCSCLVRLR